MTTRPLDPAEDLLAVRDATKQLLDAVAQLDAAAVGEPSRLPGWTRGHVLAHIARNADSLVNLLTWATTGEETPQYESGQRRNADIEAGSGRPLEEQIADLHASANRFWEAAQAFPPQAYAAQVVMRSGQVIAAAEIPWRRLIEVNLHHVDLGIGWTTEQLPAEFVARELAFVMDGLHAHDGIATVRLQDSETGETWDIGAAEKPEATVSGPKHALLGWVTGRSAGEGLVVDPEVPLPTLPPLG
ncbi:maleylpyruvate isomerase family mycothiol-dependent enzyme [Wenjunlia tyrosinilytica]|uniref:Maleylpyruvate isomerase n=1 Tax=Wenjunlia tyrosinilytica TaxID=1544741 RepID=A0A917ZDK3_9ACTN|nr:maleylpyruvate isomerase family mycothiol-dependent enzyme [Wenjunlia tyrosinilytica]GGO81468.1 maleylpyruvate isomerase [Wenjunlia tyrosinilytica]